MPASDWSNATSCCQAQAFASSIQLNDLVQVGKPARLTCTCHLFPLLRIFAMLKHPLCVARVWQDGFAPTINKQKT